jgi:hypothetical protein
MDRKPVTGKVGEISRNFRQNIGLTAAQSVL